MSPDLLGGVQVRRVRRHVEEPHAPLLRFREVLDHPGLMNRMTIGHEEDSRFSPNHQTAKKLPENDGDGTVMHNEAKLALWANGRRHVQ